MSKGDVETAQIAVRAGWQVVYDHDRGMAGQPGKVDEIAYLREYIAPLVNHITFSSRSMRDEYVANGAPAELCRIMTDPVIPIDEEIQARDWSARHLMTNGATKWLPGRSGWRDIGQNAAIPKATKTSARLLLFQPTPTSKLDGCSEIFSAIKRLAMERRVELVLISNDRQGAQHLIGNSEITWHCLPWSLEIYWAALQTAAICILPIEVGKPEDHPHQVLQPVLSGVPTATNAAHPMTRHADDLAAMLFRGDWYTAISSALQGGEQKRIVRSMQVITDALGEQHAAHDWGDMLNCAPVICDEPANMEPELTEPDRKNE